MLFEPPEGGGGGLDVSLGRGVPPGPWNPDPVYDKMFVKILKNWYPVYDFQVKFHSFFCQNAWILDPVYKKSSKIFEFETLFMSGWSKNHTLKGGTSPYRSCKGVRRVARIFRGGGGGGGAFGHWRYKLVGGSGGMLPRENFRISPSTLIQRSIVFKLFHSGERFQKVPFSWIFLCVLVWTEAVSVTIKLRFQIYPA